MRRLYRKVLEKLRTYFIDNLYVCDEVIDELLSSLILDVTEAEIIQAEKSHRDKINRMLISLKPKADINYDTFKDCLLKTKNQHILDKIIETEQICESDQQSDEDTQNVLQTFLKPADRQDNYITLQEIQDVLLHEQELKVDLEDVLDSDWLSTFVTSVFPDSKYEECNVGNRGKKKKKKGKGGQQREKVFFGLSSKIKGDNDFSRERQESESSQCSDIEMNNENTESVIIKEEEETEKFALSVEEFYLWVKRVLEDHCADTTAAEKFREQDIDSSVFENLTSEELEVYLPKLGQRKKVLMMWKELRKTETQTDISSFVSKCEKFDNQNRTKEYEQLRPFDQYTNYKYKYTEGCFVPDIESRAGNPLYPVHKYYDMGSKKLNNNKNAKQIAYEVVKFGSACMNDRTNGTIHFGIKSSGEIIGCLVTEKLIERTITKIIRESFYDGQVSIALNCIRPPKCIEVVRSGALGTPLHVIEVDIVPSSKFVEDFAFFIRPNDQNQSQHLLYRFDSDVKLLHPRELDMFLKEEKNKLFNSRKEYEERKLRKPNENCNQVLKTFLCCGNDHFEQSVFPFLVLNEMQPDDIIENIEFLKHIRWRAIFDFNKNGENGCPREYLEKQHGLVFNINFIEDFDPQKTDKSRVSQTTDNLKLTSLSNWIYCNGSVTDHIDDASQWKMDRIGSFRKAIDFYVDNIPGGRGRVVIPLFGKVTKLLIEAAEEVFVKFRSRCLVITENELVSNILREALHRRNVFPSSSFIDDFFLIGLPWQQVSEAVGRFVPRSISIEKLELPRTTGVPVDVPLAFRRELCDIDILSMNECCEFKQMNEQEKEDHRRVEGENFYKGQTVSWPNLYFADQVLQRDVHHSLVQHVYDVINKGTNTNKSVRQVIVYHQPGAGGSTTSRQLLWTMREKYRCCVIKTVTKQTTEQINRLRLFGEENSIKINPIILLVDLDEEENTVKLHDELSAESQKQNCDIFCVMIICCRVSELPVTRSTSFVLLQQHLSDRELDWFKRKYENLKEIHKNDRGCNPDTLLSLNIMKENFNMDTIGKNVAEYVKDQNLTKEHRNLLKYLAFVNFYDINFQPVPVHSFDPIMETLDWISHIPQFIFKVLVNKIDQPGVSGYIPCIRIANYLLPRHVLNAVLEYEQKCGEFDFTIGEVARELLDSGMILRNSVAEHYKMFETILANIIKKRRFTQPDEKKMPFSPLVMEFLERKDRDTAIDIMDKIYNITDDPMVAQQLARLHADMGNWEDAHRSIELAMKQKQDHTFLMHTCGQVYKMEFESICKQKKNCFDDDAITQVMQIAQCAFFYFKKSQKVSRSENVTPQNHAGFDGEILLALDVLNRFPLTDVTKVCERKKHMSNVRIEITTCVCKFLSELPNSTKAAIETLQTDIYIMRANMFTLHNDHFLNYNYLNSLAKGRLQSYKMELTKSFSKRNTKGLPETSYIDSFIDATQTDIDTLTGIVKILRTRYENLSKQQIRIFLASVLELFLRNPKLYPVEPTVMLKLSRKFYEMLPDPNPTCTLEAHLMFIAIHWPLERKTELRDLLCPHSLLIKALASWQHITDEKPNKSKHVDKIIFFLAKEGNFPCLIKIENVKSDNVAVLKGRVCSNGFEIDVTPYGYRTENIPSIRLSAMQQVKMSSKWNKQTDIVIGFGLHGPKADLLEHLHASRNINISPRNVRTNSLQVFPPTAGNTTRHNIKSKSPSKNLSQQLQNPTLDSNFQPIPVSPTTMPTLYNMPPPPIYYTFPPNFNPTRPIFQQPPPSWPRHPTGNPQTKRK